MPDVSLSLELFQLPDGKRIQMQALSRLLPDPKSAIFFGKVYKLDAYKLGQLLSRLFNTSVVAELTTGTHSTELQDYIVGLVPEDILTEVELSDEPVPDGEVLPYLWEEAMVTVAQSIQEVADKVRTTIDKLPSRQGQMLFSTLRKLNHNRPTVGTYAASIQHNHTADALVIFDVSGSMTQVTVEAIVADVVALAYNAKAHLALVSNNAIHFEPGAYDVKKVLAAAEYGGTQYEKLVPLLNRDWGNVISIADYDSSWSAKGAIANCTGRIGTLYDVSLVNTPTYLAECVGQLADEVKPILIAADRANLIRW